MSPPAQKFVPSPLSSSTRRFGWPWQTMMASHSALKSSALMPLAASRRFGRRRAVHSDVARRSALKSSVLMPLAASGRLRRSRAMPSAMSSRTGPLSIMASFRLRLDKEREREQRFLVVDQDHLLVRHFQLAIDIAKPVFVARGPDRVVAQAGFKHHAVAGDRDIAAGLLVEQLD